MFKRALNSTTISQAIDIQYSQIGEQQNLVTGISAISNNSNKFNVYPNPFSYQLTIEVTEQSSVEIIDVNGNTVLTANLNAIIPSGTSSALNLIL